MHVNLSFKRKITLFSLSLTPPPSRTLPAKKQNRESNIFEIGTYGLIDSYIHIFYAVLIIQNI